MRAPLIALTAVVIGLLMGCRSPVTVPVVERAQPPTEKINTHWVNPGDTLYAIAWRYNLDVGELAQANDLSLTTRLRVGELLRIDVNEALRHRKQKPGLWKSKGSGSSVERREQHRTHNQHYAGSVGDSKPWQWPLSGKVLKGYSVAGRQGHKGIVIDGRKGDSVYAAKAGKVVYAGTGLPAYGKLLILEHRGQYLSAYAHNSRLLVSEGDKVGAGEKIAEVGRTGTSYHHLYFEIRRQGKPVNPLGLLPSKAVANKTTHIRNNTNQS